MAGILVALIIGIMSLGVVSTAVIGSSCYLGRHLNFNSMSSNPGSDVEDITSRYITNHIEIFEVGPESDQRR